jgi:uncharacterized RDD family membrane protein YckC
MGRDEKMSTGSSTQVDFNHWLMRFLALVIDSIITYIPAYILYAVIAAILWPAPWWAGYWGGWAPWWAMWLLWPFIAGVIQVFYFAFLEVSWGATVGKRILGFQVQMVNGSKVTFDKAFIRNISKIYGLFLLLDWLIGVFTPGHDPHQKYTDRIAGTTVVSVKAGFASGAAPPPPPPPPS